MQKGYKVSLTRAVYGYWYNVGIRYVLKSNKPCFKSCLPVAPHGFASLIYFFASPSIFLV